LIVRCTLGFTIGAIVLIVICIVACVVIAVAGKSTERVLLDAILKRYSCLGVYAVVRKRRAQSQLMSAYGEGKPMQSFETVTAKPSTALRDGSDDESPFGANTLNASNGSGTFAHSCVVVFAQCVRSICSANWRH
jgi:hypothetical protein